MTDKHTPGPWKWDVWDTENDLLRGADDHLILDAACSLTNLADARLIASAPSLLEACEAALEQLETACYLLKWDTKGPTPAGHAIRLLRSNIAQAKGEDVPPAPPQEEGG